MSAVPHIPRPRKSPILAALELGAAFVILGASGAVVIVFGLWLAQVVLG